jgi:uncharacterized OsmC-like protein
MGIFHIEMNEKGEGSVNGGNGTLIKTSIPVEFMGTGVNPSSTDLLAISLATCIGSSLVKSGRPFWSSENFRMDVSRSLVCNPKMLESISINIITKSPPDEDAQRTLDNAIKTSTVRRALSTEINLDTTVSQKEDI